MEIPKISAAYRAAALAGLSVVSLTACGSYEDTRQNLIPQLDDVGVDYEKVGMPFRIEKHNGWGEYQTDVTLISGEVCVVEFWMNRGTSEPYRVNADDCSTN